MLKHGQFLTVHCLFPTGGSINFTTDTNIRTNLHQFIEDEYNVFNILLYIFDEYLNIRFSIGS